MNFVFYVCIYKRFHFMLINPSSYCIFKRCLLILSISKMQSVMAYVFGAALCRYHQLNRYGDVLRMDSWP